MSLLRYFDLAVAVSSLGTHYQTWLLPNRKCFRLCLRIFGYSGSDSLSGTDPLVSVPIGIKSYPALALLSPGQLMPLASIVCPA